MTNEGLPLTPPQWFGLPGRVLCQILRLVLLLSLTTASGCATPMLMNYLQQAQDRATQDEVRRELGEPVATFPDEDGRSRWIYRHLVYSQSPPFGVSSCVEYNLIFDREQVLRQWIAREWPPHGC